MEDPIIAIKYIEKMQNSHEMETECEIHQQQYLSPQRIKEQIPILDISQSKRKNPQERKIRRMPTNQTNLSSSKKIRAVGKPRN